MNENISFTLEELELLEKCLSKYFFDIGGIPEVVISCEEKIIKLKESSGESFKDFAEFVAEEIFSEEWEFNKDSFSEIACRKLYKLGVIDKTNDEWVYRENKE